jgi:MFS transporter, DHA2 family, multidrug resistance protein
MTSATPAIPAPDDERIDIGNLLTFICLVFGMFMAILDIQIVSASMADIRAGLSASKDEVTWVQTSYLIAEVIMIPLTGFFSRALGTRYLFAMSAAGFTFASLMCGLATSINDMIIWRAAQGFLGGAMVPLVFAMSWVLFPRSKQRIISPMIALILTTAPTIGPSVGGYVTEALSWRWLFFINIIPGIIITIVALVRINFDKPDFALLKKLDWTGMIGMAVSLGCLQYLLEEGPRHGWFDDPEVLISALVSAVAALIFIWRIRVAPEPIVDFRPFKHRNFALGSVFSFVVGMGLFGLTFLFPIYLGQVRGHNAVTIGETLFVTGAAMFVVAPINSRLIGIMDPRLMMALGLTSFGIGTYLMAGVTRDWDFWELLVPQIFRGAGLMMAMLPINNMSMGSLPQELLKGGAALYNLIRILGGAFGVALLTSALNARTDLHLARLHERVTATHSPVTETLAELTRRYASYGSDAPTIALQKLNEIVHRQGLVMAFADVFWMLTIVFGTLAAATFLMKRPVIPGISK